jgi:hypothetical protein
VETLKKKNDSDHALFRKRFTKTFHENVSRINTNQHIKKTSRRSYTMYGTIFAAYESNDMAHIIWGHDNIFDNKIGFTVNFGLETIYAIK